MTALFTLAAVVQANDPDPLRWIAMYGIAAAISAYAAITSRVPRFAATLLGAAAVAWAVSIAADGPGFDEYRRMFDAWEMRSAPIEEAREVSGLLIVAGWMIVLAIGRRAAGRRAHVRTDVRG
jgi:hypothetical protein